ncbi:MAG: hypothetical protein GDA55_04765 [Cellvibrionales bacterium]|nr:hypothetical protein [Cellvibrionales bacterium]
MPKRKKKRRLKKPPVASLQNFKPVDLLFPQSVAASDGFTASSLSQFNGDPASSVRELIQNSLDAVVESASAASPPPPACVRFLIENHKISTIPGMDSYWRAYVSAKKQHPMNRQTENAAAPMGQYQGRDEDEVPVLFVMDNGIGLDRKRIGAMLADGVSYKEGEGSSGSFGNGHLTSFALSNLRYVFYGGVPKQGGDMIFSGHAILAAHVVDDNTRGKDGYYVRDFKNGKLGHERFEFGSAKETPPFLRPKLEYIQQKWGHGALIAIPAFNHFRKGKKNSVTEIILREAALNFFVAIDRKKLRIEVVDGENTEILDSGRLRLYLEKEKDNKRRIAGFPSGDKVWSSYLTLMQGKSYDLQTTLGRVKMYARQGQDIGGKRIVLCRNGMWITHRVPRLLDKFADRVNFDALLLVDAEESGDAHDAIKLAETPLHNKLEIKRITDSTEKKKFQTTLDEVCAGISEVIEKQNEEEFEVDDILPIEVGDAMQGDKPMRQGRIQPINTRRAGGDRQGGKRKKQKRGGIKPGQTIDVNLSSRRLRPGTVSAHFKPQENCEDVELRLSLDSGTDVTCAGLGQDLLNLIEVRTNGKPIDSKNAIKNDKGDIQAFRLGKWESGKFYAIEVDYDSPGDESKFALIFDLVRRKTKPADIEESADA